jgi:regulatory protein
LKVTFQPKHGNRDRWEILVDGEKWIEVHRAIFGRKPSFPPLSHQENLQSVFDAFEYRRVKGYVLWRLSTQSYHSEQLAKLLRERLVQHGTIDRVLKEYQEMSFLDDDAWLQSFMRIQQKRYSLRVIVSKLHAKGLSTKTIQRVAKEWKNPEEEMEAIQHLLKTRYRTKDLSQYQDRQKVIAALMRKGYTFDQIQMALTHRRDV